MHSQRGSHVHYGILGRPVLTADQVTMWNALRLGISTRGLAQFGSLFKETASKELASATLRHW